VLRLCPRKRARKSGCLKTCNPLSVKVDELFDAWERAWSGRDPAGFEPVCAPGFRYEDPLTPEPLDGPRALAAHAKRLWQAFPDARLNQTGDRLANDTYACAPCKLLGTHRGPIGRIAPTGRFVVVHALVYAELREGRLLRARAFFDAHDAAVQLGVLPRPGTAGERALLMLRGFGLRG
jgi:predicted ester cyclase